MFLEFPARVVSFARRICHGLVLIGLAGCATRPMSDVPVLAVNIGGPSYRSADGILYAADKGATKGDIRQMHKVFGTQDVPLYERYREGHITGEYAVPNGTWDVTLDFAEPSLAPGNRRFDVYLEGKQRWTAMDVAQSRDGRKVSALTVTFPNVRVHDGVLSLDLRPVKGDAILSAILVRKHHSPAPMTMVWHDEFNGNRLDKAAWNIVVWPPRTVNDEDQAYTGRPANLRVENGHLVIEAKREDYGEARYTSARINTLDKENFRYGRIEVRARLPRGQGTWPAIWMLPVDPYVHATTCDKGSRWQGSSTCDAWPNSGEIDIMEHVGYQPGHIHATVHTEAYNWSNWQQRKGRILVGDPFDQYHTYAIEWRPSRIDMFVDGSVYFSYTNDGSGWRAWPFDRPFYLILNLAVGGMWGRAGGPIDDEVLPQRLMVDYVRVYRFNDHGGVDGDNGKKVN